MSKERELIEKLCSSEKTYSDWLLLRLEAIEFLTKPEQEPEQEPVAWITEWVQRYRHNDTPIMDRAVSFTKGDAPAVPNPNYIPLYTAPPTREPLSDGATADMWHANKKATHADSYWAGVYDAEKAHGFGGGE